MTADRSVVIEFGEFVVRPRDFLLVRGGQPCRIEPTPFRVLLFLLRNPGRLITKDELVRGVWTDCSVTDNSLTRSIATLRRLLGDNFRESKYIETVPRVGYRFCCPVSVGEDDVDRPANIDLSNREFVDSIAVLPFENPAGEGDVVDFGYGVDVGVTDSLSRLPRLRVVRCTAAFKDKELGRDAVRAGYQLGARVVLTGHVALEGKDLAIQVELIDAEHRAQLWSAHFRRRAEDVYAVQAEIAEQIANKLKPGIDGGRRSISFSQPIESREAYYLLLRGLHWSGKFSAEGMTRAIDYIRQAIDADPAYARAWAMLAHLFVMVGYVDGEPPKIAFPKAKAAAIRALEIDADEADAHAALSFVYLVYEWDWDGAKRELDRALELRPNLAIAHLIYSFWYLTQGLFESAIVEGEIACEIDPLSAICSCSLAQTYYLFRQYDTAIERFERTIDLDASFRAAHQLVAVLYATKGMREEALAALDQGFGGSKDRIRSKGFRGIVDTLTGTIHEAREALVLLRADLTPPNFSSAYHCAVLHALLGENDQACACLELARQGRSIRLPFLAVAPNFGHLKMDPRFSELRQRIGIPQLEEMFQSNE